MPHCQSCGAEIKGDENKYCPACGKPISELESRVERKLPKEKIPEMKTIVYKTLVDPSTVKLIGEREKGKLFTKMGFLRPKPEEVQWDSLKKYYELYITVNGRYTIDYYRKHVYTLEVDEDVRELVIFDHVLRPKTRKLAKLRRGGKEVELESEQRILHESAVYLILDRKGQEVDLKQLPSAPSEEQPEKILAESERVRLLEIPAEKAIDAVRSKIAKRPLDAERIIQELFEVSEYSIVYTPVYEATYRNTKNNEIKILKIDGVTCKVR